jgi:integrase
MRDEGIGDTALFESHRLLKRVLKNAVADDIITKNPVDRVEPPKTPAPERHALETDDMKRMTAIVTTGKPSAYKTAVCLGLSLGARLGEVLGLTWGHVSLNENRPFAYIVQQHTRYNERTALKTDKDNRPIGRVVPLDATTVQALLAWKVEQCLLLNKLGIEQGTDTPIVTNAYGDWVGHPKFSKWFRDFCVENGFGYWETDEGKRIVELSVGDDTAPYSDCVIEWRDAQGWHCDGSGRRFSRTYKRPKVKRHYRGLVFHELRHSHFTRRLANGMDIPTAQALGGWSKPTMLLNTYTHPVPENVWAAAGFMDDLR